jgi:uncharacterized Zn-finger protein
MQIILHQNPPKCKLYSTKIHQNANYTPPKSTKNNNLNCIYCNKIFSRSDSLYRHINSNRCKQQNILTNEIEILKKRKYRIKRIISKRNSNIKKRFNG